MDEVFWANVVKKWSEASENVIKLKEELLRVKAEAKLYHNINDDLLRQSERVRRAQEAPRQTLNEGSSSMLGDRQRIPSIPAKDDLEEVESGLHRAKQEYHRLQHELSSSTERIRALVIENAALRSKQRELELAPSEVSQEELETLRKDKCSLLEKNQQLEKVLHELTTTLTEIDSAELVAVQKENRELRAMIESQKEKNKDLLEQVQSLRDRLQKVEASKHALRKSMMQLQNITRHASATTLRAISSNLEHMSPRVHMPPTLYQGISGEDDSDVQRPAHRPEIPGTMLNDDVTIIEPIISVKGVIPSSSLPMERARFLDSLPTVDYDWKAMGTAVLFDREFLKRTLGENVQLLLDRMSETMASTDKKAMISTYLCPTLSHHPWCPSMPGQHGFIFVGLGKDRDTYAQASLRNLFIGLPKTSAKKRKFQYLGKYKVHRVESLGVEEWMNLSDETKHMYSKVAKDKLKDPRTVEEIEVAFERQELSVPCVVLQCVSFDREFYAALCAIKHGDL
ncbi:hypothetical protein BJ165DRAFT_1432397 [Panaeolus papilionaceus]|nr:hypothetical protein BJ165DRAFT_1432397 [Panaeolus papilionaceus]